MVPTGLLRDSASHRSKAEKHYLTFVRRASVTSPLISTVWWFRPYKPYIFWKHLIQGYQNWYYQVSHTQIHKYKYTNTQIHKYTNTAYDKVPESPNMLYIFEESIVQGYFLSVAQLYKV